MADISKALIFKTLRVSSTFVLKAGKSNSFDIGLEHIKAQYYQFFSKSVTENIFFATPSGGSPGAALGLASLGG